MIDIFINTEYHELFKITNSKLGKIIFYKKSLFTNYFTMINYTNNKIEDNEDKKDIEEKILNFYIKNENLLNLNLKKYSIETLIKYIKNINPSNLQIKTKVKPLKDDSNNKEIGSKIIQEEKIEKNKRF